MTLNYPDASILFDSHISSLKGYYTLNRVGDRFTAIVHSKTATEPWLDPVDKQTAMVIPFKDVETVIDTDWNVDQRGPKPPLNEARTLRVKRCSLSPFFADDDHAPELVYDPQMKSFYASARTFTCEAELVRVKDNDIDSLNMDPISIGAEISVTWKIDPSRYAALQDRIVRGEQLSLSPDDFAVERSVSAGGGSLLDIPKGGMWSAQAGRF